MGNRQLSSKVDILRTDSIMSHNEKYYSKHLTRNMVKSKKHCRTLKKMAKCNKHEFKNAVRERELEVHCSSVEMSLFHDPLLIPL